MRLFLLISFKHFDSIFLVVKIFGQLNIIQWVLSKRECVKNYDNTYL